jgi:PAS domain S-box-containing protein
MARSADPAPAAAVVEGAMAQAAIELILFRQLATSLAVPVFLVDHRGDLVFLNEAAERLLGMRFDDLDELPFATWSTAFRPRSPDGTVVAPESLPLVQAIMSRRPAHGELVITGNDGTDRSIEVTAFPLEGGRGRLIGAVAMFWERGGA